LKEELRFPELMKIEGLCLDVLNDCAKNAGGRMKTIDLTKVLKNDRYDWGAGGNFLVKFANGTGTRKLQSIHHFNKDAADLTNSYIDSTWTLRDNFHDMLAHFSKGRNPPVYLHTFFNDDPSSLTGPFRYTHYVGPNASRRFKAYCEARHLIWSKGLAETKAKQTAAKATATKLDTAKKQDSTRKSRVASSAYFASKKRGAEATFDA